MGAEHDAALAKKGRVAGLVMAGVMLGWLGAQWLGKTQGWSLSTALVIDLVALAAFAWALWTTFTIWRARQTNDR